MRRIPIIQAAYFGSVLGIAGLGGTWRAAHAALQMPALVGELLMAAAAIVWAVLITLYALKWVVARNEAMAEAQHPIQCCFIGLVGVSTILIGLGALPYSRRLAEGLCGLGTLYTLAFAVWRQGSLWRGGRDAGTNTPVLYLPAVAGSFVISIGAAALGEREWAELTFGAGLLSWLAIESVLLHRLYNGPEMPPAMRPSLGIQLAPPAVGALAYLGTTGGMPDLMAKMLLGYGLLQALLLMRLLSWIMQQPFVPAYWAFTFGATALASAALRMSEHGDTGVVGLLAPWLFLAANIVVALVAFGTLRLFGATEPQRGVAEVRAS